MSAEQWLAAWAGGAAWHLSGRGAVGEPVQGVAPAGVRELQ